MLPVKEAETIIKKCTKLFLKDKEKDNRPVQHLLYLFSLSMLSSIDNFDPYDVKEYLKDKWAF